MILEEIEPLMEKEQILLLNILVKSNGNILTKHLIKQFTKQNVHEHLEELDLEIYLEEIIEVNKNLKQ